MGGGDVDARDGEIGDEIDGGGWVESDGAGVESEGIVGEDNVGDVVCVVGWCWVSCSRGWFGDWEVDCDVMCWRGLILNCFRGGIGKFDVYVRGEKGG